MSKGMECGKESIERGHQREGDFSTVSTTGFSRYVVVRQSDNYEKKVPDFKLYLLLHQIHTASPPMSLISTQVRTVKSVYVTRP